MTHVRPFRLRPLEVSVVCQGYAPLPLDDECPGQDVDWGVQRARYGWAFHDDTSWAWHVHAFAVRTSSSLVMVDTGLGVLPPILPWAPGHGRAAGEAYRAAGVDPNDVSTVILTHLHADHAGGATEAGEPRFPNARYVVHPADWDHFAPFGGDTDGDGVRPSYAAREALGRLEELDMLDLEPDDRAVVPGVRVEHAPGHTPGHRTVVVSSGEGELLLTGDLLHTPIQVAHPTWPSNHDVDSAVAAASRAGLLARAAEDDWTVGVSHFGEPFGRVGRDGWRATPPD